MSKLPEFIKRSVERAIEDALHPKGLILNGPCMASVDVTHLQRLLMVARMAEDSYREGYARGWDDGVEDAGGKGMC